MSNTSEALERLRRRWLCIVRNAFTNQCSVPAFLTTHLLTYAVCCQMPLCVLQKCITWIFQNRKACTEHWLVNAFLTMHGQRL